MINKSIVVGITHGDINSISYEIIMKTFKDPRMLEFCCPVVYGSSKVASFYKKVLTFYVNFAYNNIVSFKV
jgi:4-hydroxythreonine-4-phosphate dehydrogenase